MRGRWMIAGALVSTSLSLPLCAQPTALDEGVSLMREGHFNQALVKLKQAHSIAPHNATIENLLGITETQLGQIAHAFEIQPRSSSAGRPVADYGLRRNRHVGPFTLYAGNPTSQRRDPVQAQYCRGRTDACALA